MHASAVRNPSLNSWFLVTCSVLLIQLSWNNWNSPFYHSWHFYRCFTLKGKSSLFYLLLDWDLVCQPWSTVCVFSSTTIKATEKGGDRGWCFRNADMSCHVLFLHLDIISDSDVYRKQSLASWSVANYCYTCLQPSLIIILYYKVWILSCMNWQPQNWKLPMQATEWLMRLQDSCLQWRRQARPQGKYFVVLFPSFSKGVMKCEEQMCVRFQVRSSWMIKRLKCNY